MAEFFDRERRVPAVRGLASVVILCSFAFPARPAAGQEDRQTDPVPSSETGTSENETKSAPEAKYSESLTAVELNNEATQLVRGLILLLLPETFSDSDDWGSETRIQSGLNVDLKKGRLQTSRRWNSVNHGSWLRADGRLKEPAENFRISIWLLTRQPDEAVRYQMQAAATIRATGRQQQWNYGLMLWSVTAEAEFDVTLETVFELRQQVAVREGRAHWQLLPVVQSARADLTRFSLRRISHAKGAAVREFGSWFEGLIRRQVRQLNNQLPDRINRKIQRKKDQLTVPLWFSLPPSDAEPTPEER